VLVQQQSAQGQGAVKALAAAKMELGAASQDFLVQQQTERFRIVPKATQPCCRLALPYAPRSMGAAAIGATSVLSIALAWANASVVAFAIAIAFVAGYGAASALSFVAAFALATVAESAESVVGTVVYKRLVEPAASVDVHTSVGPLCVVLLCDTSQLRFGSLNVQLVVLSLQTVANYQQDLEYNWRSLVHPRWHVVAVRTVSKGRPRFPCHLGVATSQQGSSSAETGQKGFEGSSSGYFVVI